MVATHSHTPLTMDDVVRGMHEEIRQLRDDGRAMLADGICPERLDQLLFLRFRLSRLTRRLDAVTRSGLLTLSAWRLERPAVLVRHVAAEVAGECERRGVQVRCGDLDLGVEQMIDAEQVTEALRAIFDDVLAGAFRGSRIEVTTARRPDSGFEIRIAHGGVPVTASVGGLGFALLLASDPGRAVEVACPRDGSDIVVLLPALPAVVPLAQPAWRFPAPAA